MQGRKNTKKIRRRRGVADWDGNGDVEWGWGADRLSDQEVDKMNRCFVWFGHVLDMFGHGCTCFGHGWTWLDMVWTCFLSDS